MNTALIIVFLVAVGFGAGFVQRVSGFGLGIFAMIFLPMFMPSVAAAASVSCLFSCFTSTYNTVKYRKSISYKTALPMLISSLVTIPVAVYFASKLDQSTFKILIGALLVLMSIFLLFWGEKIKVAANIKNGIISGSTSGILSGLFSTGGPPAVIYLTSALTEKLVYFSTIQFFFCVTNLYAAATRAINGILTLEVLVYSAIGLCGCMLGDLLGSRVFNLINGEKLKKIIYAVMFLSGIVMFL